jgi:hypothetical protein
MPKDFKGSDDGKEFFIVDFIVLFGGLEGFGMVGDRMPTI